MSEETQTRPECVLWIDRTNRIISFKKAEGFEAKVFPTRDEKIAYAFTKKPPASSLVLCIIKVISFAIARCLVAFFGHCNPHMFVILLK